MIQTLLKQTFDLSAIKDEFRFWVQVVKPLLPEKQNFLSICEYGITEMINNVIDHSGATEFIFTIIQHDDQIQFILNDNGVGIFHKILKKFNFESELEALIELVKGKLTTDPKHHSGEGIFFTSRGFDSFSITSENLSAVFSNEFCEVKKTNQPAAGTCLEMKLAVDTAKKLDIIFNQFCDPESFAFNKTRFSIAIAQFEGSLVSRSQAKRIAARLENFSEVEIDFTDVESIGQGFADELFRVWKNHYPETQLHAINTNESVKKMISHVLNT